VSLFWVPCLVSSSSAVTISNQAGEVTFGFADGDQRSSTAPTIIAVTSEVEHHRAA
jgi:hypothetical protein